MHKEHNSCSAYQEGLKYKQHKKNTHLENWVLNNKMTSRKVQLIYWLKNSYVRFISTYPNPGQKKNNTKSDILIHFPDIFRTVHDTLRSTFKATPFCNIKHFKNTVEEVTLTPKPQ